MSAAEKHWLWKPGYAPNPKGRPKLPEHLRLIKEFTSYEIARYIAKYGRNTIQELILTESDDDAPVIERIFARMFRQAFDGKPEVAIPTLKFLLDRSIGKVPDVIYTETPDDEERDSLRKMPLGDLLQMVKRMIPDSPLDTALLPKESLD